MLKVFISGQKYFGEQVFNLCRSMEGVEVVGVSAPIGDKYLGRAASTWNVPITPSGTLSADTMPDNVDLGITAHSFDYIGRKTRYKPLYGWIGYHAITGGTVFWLNAGIDRGDIAYQEFCFISPELLNMDPKKASAKIWRNSLQDMGIRLLEKALRDIKRGVVVKTPQDKNISTWEPSTDVKDIYRPDSLLLEEKKNNTPDEWYK